MRFSERTEQFTRAPRTWAHFTRCKAQNCYEFTREGKPYCSKHVEQNKHAAKVLVELARQEREQEAVRRGGWQRIDTSAPFAQSILQVIQVNGTISTSQLAQEFQLTQRKTGRPDLWMAEQYALALGLKLAVVDKKTFAVAP